MLLEKTRDKKSTHLQVKNLTLTKKSSFIVATVARRCLFSSEFSLLQGINGLFRSVVILFDIVIGLPNLKAKDLEYKLQVERAK